MKAQMQSLQKLSNAGMTYEMIKFYMPFTKKRKEIRILDTTYGHGTFWTWWEPNPGYSYRGFLDGIMLEPGIILLTGEQVSGGSYNRVTMDKRDGLGANVVADHNGLEKIFKRGEDYFDVIFYDPPYGGVEDTEVWKSMPGYKDRQMNADKACLVSDDHGALSSHLARQFERFIPNDGIVIYKNTHLQKIPRPLWMYDYMIQDLGYQNDRFKHPKARPCHAFWMVLKPHLDYKEKSIVGL